MLCKFHILNNSTFMLASLLLWFDCQITGEFSLLGPEQCVCACLEGVLVLISMYVQRS